jgi:26S proteasome regulatory subunit N12
MSVSSAVGLVKDLTAQIEASKLDEAQACLSKLKVRAASCFPAPPLLLLTFVMQICMTEFTSLPPCGLASANAAQERMVARQTFEQAALLSVKSQDMVAFECNVAQLKPLYNDPVEAQSQLRYPVLGMNLLHLLVDNRLAEFHSELELIPEDGRANECIAFAIQLEQYFMEGSYSKVLNARSSCPQQFSYFMDGLVNRIR